MVKIKIDEQLKAQLLESRGVVELVDDAGNRLGHVIPVQPTDLDPKSVFPELTPEEIERRCAEPGPRHTTEQVIERLQSRMKDG